MELRKTKITATDATVIMGVNPWKTKLDLYNEKISLSKPVEMNEYMIRGLELEPSARQLFTIKTGIEVEPMVLVKDWTMASVDGISRCRRHLLEIKCPGPKDHDLAVRGFIPEKYYPQLQHQMMVCELDEMYYFSFDGIEGVVLTIPRDPVYCDKMLEEEWKFYQCLQNSTPPELSEDDYVEKNDDIWIEYASQWKEVKEQMKSLEEKETDLRNHLIYLSGSHNSKGAGIKLYKKNRKGTIDYSSIPELKDLDLEKYRKSSSHVWTISIE